MRKLLLGALVVLVSTFAFASDPIFIQDENLGSLSGSAPKGGRMQNAIEPDGDLGQAAQAFLRRNAHLFQGTGREDFVVTNVQRDELGQVHVRTQEMINGMPVVGAEMVLHANAANGRVRILNGNFVPDVDLPSAAMVNSAGAIESAVFQMGLRQWDSLDIPQLTYVMNEKGRAFLAWAETVTYFDDEGEQIDRIFADATTGDLVLRQPKIYRALNRATYSCNNGTTLPGTLKRSEGSANIGDAAIDAAHNNAGSTYNFYKNVFNRDSYDNAGAQLKSSAHYSSRYNNAYWNGSQMVYGDGDGTTFSYLSGALDVVAHELTHAVTERTANLTYSNESGALNEAWSDIMGAACESYTGGGSVTSNTWKLGEGIYTPATSGDALRYMNDPALGGDYDYYPTRYTGTSDNGGVHTNSGIANLAFYLLSQGGTHPRSKTTVVVPAVTITHARAIFYRALTVYMTSSTNFQGARNATASAATDLYGATDSAAVQKAWDAVGVPGGSTGGTVTTLSNGVTVSSISASKGTWKYYKITVPSGQTSLKITMSGGTGDADLYVKLGSSPTLSSYNYRPYLSGNNETVTVTNPSAGDWYVGIYGYAAFSGVSLNATYSTSGGGGSTCTSYSGSISGTGGSGYAPSTSGYTSSVSGTHTGKLTGPSSADFDLYLYKWNGSSWSIVARSEGSTATENISYSGTAGTYRWRIYSYSGSGTWNLCTTKP